jgi:hypothetical protein
MKRFAIATLILIALLAYHADSAFALWPNQGPVNPATYGWRPWWGGLHGWEPYYGSRAYPAYPGSPYRADCWGSPPTSELDTLPFNQGGKVPYPRSFVYPWKGKVPQPPGVNTDVQNTTAP